MLSLHIVTSMWIDSVRQNWGQLMYFLSFEGSLRCSGLAWQSDITHCSVTSTAQQLSRVSLPISTFADNLDFKVVDPTGSRDWVCGSHWCCVFVVLAMACRTTNGNSLFMQEEKPSVKCMRKVCVGISIHLTKSNICVLPSAKRSCRINSVFFIQFWETCLAVG